MSQIILKVSSSVDYTELLTEWQFIASRLFVSVLRIID